MSNKIMQVYLYELKRNFSRKGYLFATFGIPLLILVAMLGYNAYTQANASDDEAEQTPAELFDFEGIQTAGYVDFSGTFGTVPDSLSDKLTRYETQDAAQQALQAEEIDVFYIISDDYLQSQEVILYLPGLALTMLNSAPIEQLIYSTVAGDVDPLILQRLRNPALIQEFNLTRGEDTAQDEDTDFIVIYIFSIVFVMGIFLTNILLLQTVIEEKENRLIEILLSTVRPTQLLMGKILALSTLGMLQIVVWVGGGLILLNVAQSLPSFATVGLFNNLNLPLDMLPYMFIYFVLGYLFFAAVNGAIGAISNSMREGPQYSAIFLIPLAIPYYLIAIFVETPNAALPVGLSMFPLTAPLSMIMRLTITEVPLIEIVISVTLLALSVVGMMWVAGRMFRVQSLLSGQPFKLKDLPALLRG